MDAEAVPSADTAVSGAEAKSTRRYCDV